MTLTDHTHRELLSNYLYQIRSNKSLKITKRPARSSIEKTLRRTRQTDPRMLSYTDLWNVLQRGENFQKIDRTNSKNGGNRNKEARRIPRWKGNVNVLLPFSKISKTFTLFNERRIRSRLFHLFFFFFHYETITNKKSRKDLWAGVYFPSHRENTLKACSNYYRHRFINTPLSIVSSFLASCYLHSIVNSHSREISRHSSLRTLLLEFVRVCRVKNFERS